MGPWKVFRLFLFFGLNNNFTESIHIPKFYLILFYHSKKLLYQLYHTILQYSQHLNFYFTIQHIRITFLHNKIIYPKTQIKTKSQNPKQLCNHLLPPPPRRTYPNGCFLEKLETPATNSWPSKPRNPQRKQNQIKPIAITTPKSGNHGNPQITHKNL